MYRRLGIALLVGALLTSLFCYAYPMIYRRIEVNVISKVYYGIWFEASTNLPSGVTVLTNYYKKDLSIRVTDNFNNLLVGKLTYRSDLTEDPQKTYWKITVYVTSVNASGTATLTIEVGTLCYINIRDKNGNMVAGYGLGCIDYTANHYVILSIDLTRSGVYEFYVIHQYLHNEYTNPPDYPPWATFNVYLTTNLIPGSSFSATVVVKYG